MSNGERPLGVSIVGILYILLGIGALLVGLGSLALFAMGGIDILGFAIGGIFIIIGLINLSIGIGCFKGWGWVWTLALVFAVLNILISVVSWAITGFSSTLIMTTLLSLIIPLVIIWYLMKENVKSFFGKT